MHSALNNLIIYNGYPLSVVVALTFHTLIFIVIIYLQQSSDSDVLELVQPTIIKALIIDENPQVVNRQNLERQRIEQQRQRELEQERQRQAEAERLEQERQQQEVERARQEEEQRQAALREREELERQQAEQRRREQEQREEELRRQAERAEQERQRQRELERQQAQAAAEAAAAEAARNEFELVQSATGLIQQVVQENWSRPPSARNGMRTILQIRMLPTGELLEVTITQSSGDPAFDRSAETAVYRAAPFSELQSLPINVFNSNFRSLSLIFEPDDLLN
ncbi:MAG: cell envelope integrity protein TolA [Pseudomonadales bacterium]|nr:cell envelope integrity protein TolA [Pseudomonadales bacterium]